MKKICLNGVSRFTSCWNESLTEVKAFINVNSPLALLRDLCFSKLHVHVTIYVTKLHSTPWRTEIDCTMLRTSKTRNLTS